MTTEEATRWLMDLRERTDALYLERDRSIPMAQIEGLSEESLRSSLGESSNYLVRLRNFFPKCRSEV